MPAACTRLVLHSFHTSHLVALCLLVRLTQSKKQGTSAEEKAVKLLGWFHSTKDFYSLKEIEKAGVKATGISGMIIKE